jgi:hypothetical protein
MLSEKNLDKHKRMTLSLSKKTKVIPSFSQESFYTYLVDLLVVQDLPFLLMYVESDFKIDASKAALMKLAKYYDISSELCTIATVLDPRLKLDFYRGDKNPSAENPAEIMSYVRSFYDRDYAPGGSISQNPSPAKKPNILGRFYKKSTASDKSEIAVYLSEPVADDYPEFQVLDYWKINSARFPNLSRMARDYLAVPGTSTPSERAFSGGRQLITDFRCRLKGETITACSCLRTGDDNGIMLFNLSFMMNFYEFN